jgi:hypothetical protein
VPASDNLTSLEHASVQDTNIQYGPIAEGFSGSMVDGGSSPPSGLGDDEILILSGTMCPHSTPNTLKSSILHGQTPENSHLNGQAQEVGRGKKRTQDDKEDKMEMEQEAPATQEKRRKIDGDFGNQQRLSDEDMDM